jgi:hypothetical protein
MYMTKRDRLSFALRRLRNVKAQDDTALRIQKAHDLIKEVIDELSKGTKNADLGQHTIEILDDLYAQNIGVINDGRLPAPAMLPDCAEQIHRQTQALQAVTTDDEQTRRSEVATVLHNTLSYFALGPNEAPIHEFLDAFHEQVKLANARPTPIPDRTEELQCHIETLSELDGLEEPDQGVESAVNSLCHALLVFAQGPNEQPIKTLLGKVKETMKRASAIAPPVPDYSACLQPHIDTLDALVHQDEREGRDEAEATALRGMLLTFAQGPNAEPIQTALATLEKLNRKKDIGAQFAYDEEQLQHHIEDLAALDGLDDPDALTAAAAITLYETLTDMAKGPQAASIRALLEVFDRVTGAV